jgi:hypothetical protein
MVDVRYGGQSAEGPEECSDSREFAREDFGDFDGERADQLEMRDLAEYLETIYDKRREYKDLPEEIIGNEVII